MVKEDNFKPTKNTFYRGRPMTGDTGVNAIHKDVYDGYKATATIGGKQQQGVYLATTEIAPQPYYGAGDLNEMHLRFSVRNVSGTQIAIPKVSIFKMQDGIAVAPGEQPIVEPISTSGTTDQLVVFGSTYNFETPFLVEPFDGKQKGFQDNFFIETLTKQKQADTNYIKASDLYTLYSAQGCFAWDGASKSIFKKNCAVEAGVYDKTADAIPFGKSGVEGWGAAKLELYQLDNGNWRTIGNFLKDNYGSQLISAGIATITLGLWQRSTEYDEPNFPLDTWFEAGAYPIASIVTGIGDYQTESEAMVKGKITPKNSIFTSVGGSIQINGPWAKSVEDTGGSEAVYAYSDVFFSEPESTDSSCLFSSLWENYTPVNSEALTSNPAGANPLGYSFDWSPFLQETFTSIDGIPMCSWSDVSASEWDRKFPVYPIMAPEIEMTFKISNLLPTPFLNVSASTVVSGTNGNTSPTDDAISLARSFNVFFSDKAYQTGRPLLKNMHRAYWPKKIAADAKTEYGPGVGFHFFKTGSSQESYYCVPSTVGQGWKGADGGSSDLKNVVYFTKGWKAIDYDERTVIPAISGGRGRIDELIASGNLVEVPSDEWFTMRIKVPFFRRGVIAYFPDILDEQGKMPWLKCYEYTRRKLNDFNSYINNPTRTMMMGTFNLRPITSGGTAYHEVNMPYIKDDFVHDEFFSYQDSQVNVYCDNIKLINFSPKVSNATKVPENPDRAGLVIPSPTYSPPFNYTTGSLANFSFSGGTGAGFIGDNYYGEQNAPSTYVISVGFDTFAQVSGAFVDKNSLALGNFFTPSPYTIPPLDGAYITAGFSNMNNTQTGRTLGIPQINYGEYDPYVSGLSVSSAAVGNGVYISMGTAGTVGDFKYKGLLNLSSSAEDWKYSSPYGRFGKVSSTENCFARSKIMSVSEEGKTIKVDDTAVLNLPVDTDYLVWLDGMPFLDRDNRKLVKILKKEGTKLYLDKTISDILAVSGSGDYLGGWKRNNLERMWISPYKYWLFIFMMNATNASGATWGDWVGILPASSNTVDRPATTYGSVLLTSGSGSYGSTYNESTYYDGPYANKWDLDYTSEGSTLDMGNDYGFGAAEWSDDGSLESLGGQIGDDFVYQGGNVIDMSGYVEVGNPVSGDPLNFGIFPKPPDQHGVYTIKMQTSSGSENNTPILLSGYLDTLPTIDDFNVVPVVNTLTESFDMYKLRDTDANSILYTWQEGNADDILYRQLIVDTKGIKDKYHGAIDYWPMNEPYDATFGYHYSGNAATKYNMDFENFGDSNYAAATTIQGFCGWGKLFQNGSVDNFYLSGGQAISGASYLDKWSITIHAKPGGEWDGVTWVSGSQANTDLFTHYGVMSISLQAPTLNNSRPYIYVKAIPTDTDGAIAGPMTTYLRSKTAIDWDGEQPLAIGVTFNKTLPRDNMKLYLNGHLEDTTGTDWTQNTVVGASGTTMRKKPLIGLNMHGLLEEITLYEKELYFPENPNQFVLNTTHLPDVSGSGILNPENIYQSRLFLVDHHNIRGSSPRLVARSNTAMWKVTGL